MNIVGSAPKDARGDIDNLQLGEVAHRHRADEESDVREQRVTGAATRWRRTSRR